MKEQERWRLIVTPGMDGATQMAMDEAILEDAASEDFMPTLRLYSWQPTCLSLGYAQPISDIDATALKAEGWEQVRRPTGGRAILHTDELTYAVILPLTHWAAAGSLIDSYRRIAGALVASLNVLGCTPRSDAHYDLPAGVAEKAPVCFEAPSNYEITVAGRKLIGSAQARRRNALLQHGSLPLHGDLTRITRVLALSEVERLKAADRLVQHALTLAEAMGVTFGWETCRDAFVEGFETTFKMGLIPGALSELEWQRAQELREIKYSQKDWNQRI